ncbi:MAG: hypothetical protein HQK53_12860, partial [Oligoflexia bacterium]|nr:hypothetical protein [Oligoflexia bacterium]
MKTDIFGDENLLLHSPFFPEKINDSNYIAKVKIKNRWIDFHINAYSPFGIEITNTHEIKFDQQITYEILLCINDFRLKINSVPIYNTKNKRRIGFRTFQKNSSNTIDGEKRNKHRFNCSVEYMPTAMAPNPL